MELGDEDSIDFNIALQTIRSETLFFIKISNNLHFLPVAFVHADSSSIKSELFPCLLVCGRSVENKDFDVHRIFESFERVRAGGGEVAQHFFYVFYLNYVGPPTADEQFVP